MAPELTRLLDTLAAGLHRRRLAFPALLVLDVMGPFSGLTTAGLQLALPWVDAFVSTAPLKEMIARPDGAAILCAELAQRLDILGRS